MELESFCWGSRTIIPPLDPDLLICRCKELEKPVEEATQTRKKKRKRDDDFWKKLARVQELLALMKELRKNRPDMIAQAARAKTVCLTLPPVCPAVCPPVCVYTMPSVCPNPCQQTAVCCLPV